MELRPYPPHIDNIKEMHFISDLTDKWAEALQTEVDRLDANLMISTLDDEGCRRYEKILDITPLETDTLQERRFRILLRWYDTFPYTKKDLIERLTRINPNGEFYVDINYDDPSLTVKLALANKKNYNDVVDLLEDLVPLHVMLYVSLLYNQWQMFSAKTWADVSTITWKSGKEDILE